MLGIQPPAHAGALQPEMQGRQIALTQAEASTHRRHVQQVEDLAQGEAAVGQLQQMLQSDQQRLEATLMLVGQAEGDEARILAVELTEHRTDVRRIGIDVRHHDDDVARPQAAIAIEARQELIVEDLHLTLRTMGHMETHGPVPRRIHCRPAFAGLGQRTQLENIILQLAEQMLGFGLGEEIDTAAIEVLEQPTIAVRLVEFVQQVDVVAALLAPARQQRLTVLMQRLGIQGLGHARLALLAPIVLPQEILVGDDVGPVMATGIVHAEQHLAEARQRGQGFEGLRRNRRQAKDHHPPRQTSRRFGSRLHYLQKAPVHSGPTACQAAVAHVGQQRPPQLRLPATALGQGAPTVTQAGQQIAARCPVVEPVGAVDLVAVIEIGQALGQLVSLAQIAVIVEKTPQRGEVGLHEQGRQEPHQAPGQGRAIQRRGWRYLVTAQHLAIGAPEKGRRQLHFQRRGHPAAALVVPARILGQRQLEPLGDAIALHQHLFVFQWRQGIPPHPADRQAAQLFEPIAVYHHESGSERLGHPTPRCSLSAARVRITRAGYQSAMCLPTHDAAHSRSCLPA